MYGKPQFAVDYPFFFLKSLYKSTTRKEKRKKIVHMLMTNAKLLIFTEKRQMAKVGFLPFEGKTNVMLDLSQYPVPGVQIVGSKGLAAR